jgi:hypothetical protein
LIGTLDIATGNIEAPHFGMLGMISAVIENPSFELDYGWSSAGNNLILLLLGTGYWLGDLWLTHGSRLELTRSSEPNPRRSGLR